MTSQQNIVDFLVDQLSDAGDVSAKKMFGDYAVYLSGKVIALICNDKLYFKPTILGRMLFDSVTVGIPYPGAKPWFLISEDDWDNRDWLTSLGTTTFNELPFPTAAELVNSNLVCRMASGNININKEGLCRCQTLHPY